MTTFSKTWKRLFAVTLPILIVTMLPILEAVCGGSGAGVGGC